MARTKLTSLLAEALFLLSGKEPLLAGKKLTRLQYSSFGFTFAASVRGLWKNDAMVRATKISD